MTSARAVQKGQRGGGWGGERGCFESAISVRQTFSVSVSTCGCRAPLTQEIAVSFCCCWFKHRDILFFAWLFFSLFISLCLCLCPSLSVSVCLSLSLSVSLSVSLSTPIFVCCGRQDNFSWTHQLHNIRITTVPCSWTWRDFRDAFRARIKTPFSARFPCLYPPPPPTPTHPPHTHRAPFLPSPLALPDKVKKTLFCQLVTRAFPPRTVVCAQSSKLYKQMIYQL